MKGQADIGIAGLAVMGANLALNFESKGYTVALYNRTTGKLDEFMDRVGSDKNFHTTGSIPEFLGFLKSPRKILMMIRAGSGVDEFIQSLRPHLRPGDILIDAGNSFFKDTIRRSQELESIGVRYVGMGVSGGEEGALNGPSLMLGCDKTAWNDLQEMLCSISAKADAPCCARVGANGAGHFVKMIHNGIEYAEMQMIAESYAYMRDLLHLTPDEMSDVFRHWNQTDELNSYLTGITAEILKKKDSVTGRYLVDIILDSAGQKGTGKWTSEAAFELSVPAPTIAESVFARIISNLKEERMAAFEVLPSVPPVRPPSPVLREEIRTLMRAFMAAKVCVLAQGFSLITAASKEYGWKIQPQIVARIWQGGCILRSAILEKVAEAYETNPKLDNLLLDPYFKNIIASTNFDWRDTVAKAVRSGIALPAFSSTVAYYDAIRTARLPANIIQALRDYFGAHMFERIDEPRGHFFHADWYDSSTKITSTDYNV